MEAGKRIFKVLFSVFFNEERVGEKARNRLLINVFFNVGDHFKKVFPDILSNR